MIYRTPNGKNQYSGIYVPIELREKAHKHNTAFVKEINHCYCNHFYWEPTQQSTELHDTKRHYWTKTRPHRKVAKHDKTAKQSQTHTNR